MTDFIRTILATAAAANATAANATPAAPSAASQPVNQIHLPPSTAAATAVAAPLAAEKLIKVEPIDTTSSTALPTPTADAGKAQRAARRDVVNARRDKRKAMTSVGASSPLSSMGLTSCGDSSSDTEDDDMMMAMDDKSKKMKTSATSSVAVAGGLAASELAVVKKPSFSSSMPPTPGLLFTPEIDAAGEERLRAMEAQLETLDPDSKEAKKKRRLIRNRMSAQLHRERKKAYVGQLEDQLLEKDRELKLLQEKLAQLMAADGSETKPTVAVAATPVAAPAQQQQQPPVAAAAPAAKPKDDDVVIKDEPTAWVDAPAWALDAADSWDLHGLEDSEMAELETADLLRDFDDPFAGLLGAGAYSDLGKPHHEIHAAKKNIAMMAAVMFSVSFFGNSPAFYNVTPGSNFGSTFSAQGAAKDLSQMSIASRIVACLEKTSWKEFRSVSSWIAAANAAHDDEDKEDDDKETTKASVASPSAASDVTSCGSPAGSVGADIDADAAMGETDLIDEFEYPVEDPFGMAAASADWLDDMEKELPKHTPDQDDAEYFLADVMRHEPVVPKSPKTTTSASSKSMTSRLYESLTALWREKQQVLLTVRDDKQQVLQRSVADMSTIRDGLESGHFFTKVFGGVEGAAGAGDAEDKSVTFLYPMSAFAGDASKSLARDGDASVDPVFLEVSCQLNGNGAAVVTSMD